jgi:hypothetical protein
MRWQYSLDPAHELSLAPDIHNDVPTTIRGISRIWWKPAYERVTHCADIHRSSRITGAN